MRTVILLLPSVAAALISFVLTPVALRLSFALGAIDLPNERKVHRKPMPRLGGLAVLSAVVLILGAGCLGIGPLSAWAPAGLCTGTGLGLIPILAISIWDDIRPRGILQKVAAQLAGASLAVWSGVVLDPVVHLFGNEIHIGILAIPLSLLWHVGVTNAFNLVDGLDGLSAGLALISAASLGAISFLSGQPGMGAASFVLAGALLGFLPYNSHPAKIFLGETGAASVGFLLACFSLVGGARLSAGFAVLLPVLALSIPVAETFISLARRALRRVDDLSVKAVPGGAIGGGVFGADRDHLHHRLVGLGLNHRRAVLVLCSAGAAAALVSLLSLFLSNRSAALLLVALLVAGAVGLARLGYDEFAVVRNGFVLRFYDAPALKRAVFVVFLDILFVTFGVYGSLVLKYDSFELGAFRSAAFEMTAALAFASVVCFRVFGVYKGAWRLAGIADVTRTVAAVGLATAAGYLIVASLHEKVLAPSVFVVFAILMSGAAIASRGSYRVLIERKWRGNATGTPVVLYGAGLGGVTALREIYSHDDFAYKPVAFLDDDPGMAGCVVQGIPIVGPLEKLRDLAQHYEDLTLVITSSKISGNRLRTTARICRENGVQLLKMDLTFRGLDLEEIDSEAVGEARSEGSSSIGEPTSPVEGDPL